MFLCIGRSCLQRTALNRVEKIAAKFGNNTNETGWETLPQRRMIAEYALFSRHTPGRGGGGGGAWKAIGDRLLKPCYLSREDRNRKIRTRKHRTDVGKHSFVNRTIKNCNQLPADLLASFPCKLSTFRKRVKKVVTSKGNSSGV
jgi:hypothetical protein